MTNQDSKYDNLIGELSGHIRMNTGFITWMVLLTALLAFCLSAYFIQLKTGLGVTGLRDNVSWGMYLANFVFFVASSLVGMLISAVLGLTGIKWITPVTRIAEIIAVAFSAVAGLVIISDMGRPDKLLNVFIYGRFQSPILWDVTVVTIYFLLSLLLYFIPMIPDIAMLKSRVSHMPGWFRKSYEILSMNWTGSAEQNKIIRKCVKVLLLLIIPTALAIHTVTSWLFAVTLRPGWDSTIFGPYFVSGAFVTGTAAVIIAMFFFRKNYKLHGYITEKHFNHIGKLLLLVSFVYLYFNINEFLIPGYKLKQADTVHLEALFTGHHAGLFWFVQLAGLVIPMLLLFWGKMRKPVPMLFIAIFILIGSWFKRYLIVVPAMEHPFLPLQHVPVNFSVYTPTMIETAVTGASFVLVLMIITLLSKFFPVVPINETIHELEESKK